MIHRELLLVLRSFARSSHYLVKPNRVGTDRAIVARGPGCILQCIMVEVKSSTIASADQRSSAVVETGPLLLIWRIPSALPVCICVYTRLSDWLATDDPVNYVGFTAPLSFSSH